MWGRVSIFASAPFVWIFFARGNSLHQSAPYSLRKSGLEQGSPDQRLVTEIAAYGAQGTGECEQNFFIEKLLKNYNSSQYLKRQAHF